MFQRIPVVQRMVYLPQTVVKANHALHRTAARGVSLRAGCRWRGHRSVSFSLGRIGRLWFLPAFQPGSRQPFLAAVEFRRRVVLWLSSGHSSESLRDFIHSLNRSGFVPPCA